MNFAKGCIVLILGLGLTGTALAFQKLAPQADSHPQYLAHHEDDCSCKGCDGCKDCKEGKDCSCGDKHESKGGKCDENKCPEHSCGDKKSSHQKHDNDNHRKGKGNNHKEHSEH